MQTDQELFSAKHMKSENSSGNTPDASQAYEDWRKGPLTQDAQSDHLTAALLTAIGLCQILREHSKPSPNAAVYFGSQDGLKSHNRLVKSGLLDHDVIGKDTDLNKLPYGFAALGRRSNRKNVWAQPMIDALVRCGIFDRPHAQRSDAISRYFQGPLAKEVRRIVEAGPIGTFKPELTLDENIRRFLLEAKHRNAHGLVAQVLVAAKLITRYELGEDYFSERELTSTSSDRRRSGIDRLGDLPIDDLTFEVAHSNPNDDHLEKAKARWSTGGFTLIVPDETVKAWRKALHAVHVDELLTEEDKLEARIKLRGIVQFVSQNIEECAGTKLADHPHHYREFFKLYNRLMRNSTLHIVTGARARTQDLKQLDKVYPEWWIHSLKVSDPASWRRLSP